MANLTSWLWPALIAACAVVAFTPLVRRLAAITNVVAHPKSDRWHRRTVPMLGGIAIFGGVAVSVIAGGWPDRTMLPLLVVGAGMFVVGLTDDFAQLKPGTKLNAQIVVACAALIVGDPAVWTGRAAFDALLTIFWIVGITNALNLLDNMDGLCAGVAGIAAMACWAALTPAVALPAHYAAAITGACVGFLLFNFNPASVFMGDSGSLFLGGSLAMLAIAGGSSAEGHLLSAIAVPVLLLLIPIFDMVFVTLSRILSRRAASTGGRDHTSHRLVAMGFSEREAVVILWGLAAVAGLAAVLGRYAIETAFIAPLLVIVVILLGIQLARVRVYDGQDFSVLTKGRYTPLLVSFTYKRRIFEVLLDVVLVALCYYGAYLIRFDEDVSLYAGLIIQSLPIIIGCQVASFGVVGVYRGTWRYIGVSDVTTFAKGIALGTVSAVIALVYLYRFEGYSRSVFVIYAMTLALCVLSARLSQRLLAEVAGRHRTTGRRALIYGAGDGGAVLLRELRSNPQYGYRAVGFIDDDASKSRKRILGVPVIGGVSDLESSVASLRPEVVIVSTPKLTGGRLEQVRQVCYASGTALMQFRFTLNGVDVTPGNVARRE